MTDERRPSTSTATLGEWEAAALGGAIGTLAGVACKVNQTARLSGSAGFGAGVGTVLGYLYGRKGGNPLDEILPLDAILPTPRESGHRAKVDAERTARPKGQVRN